MSLSADSVATHTMHVLITGASSGLGRALALEYAAAGVRLSLMGRDEPRLQEVALACKAKEAEAHAIVVDVCDAHAMRAALCAIDDACPITLLFANAGVSGGSQGSGLHGGGFMDGAEADATQLRIMDTNIQGVMHTILPLLPRFEARAMGHIGIVCSLSSFGGLPSAPAYSASKAAMLAYADALRGLYVHSPLHICAICPGYIRTPLTAANNFPMPLLMEPERAARIIRRGMDTKKRRIIFPLPLYLAFKLALMLPLNLRDRLLGSLPKK